MTLLRFLWFNIFFFSSAIGIQSGNKLFISPVKIPLYLSANFGELRADHFHSGIDIKTQGVIGKEVVAVADGYVYRIGVSPTGYGKALYLRHPNGYSTVYAHLDKFSPEIEKYVKEKQYQQKSFTVNLFPAKDLLRFKQGDLIAYSGNTGGSSGPHLHYEIRKSDNEKPMNPLLFDMEVKDNIAPIIERLYIYPLSNSTSINGRNTTKQINVTGGRGNYHIPAENAITINGKAGFGIKSYDLLNNGNNKCGIFLIELVIDDKTIYKFVMNGFLFSETKFVNSHIDYETYIKNRTHIQKAFVLPNDRLPVYSNVVNKGVFNFNDDEVHKVTFHIADVHGNKSTLSFNVKSVAESDLEVKSNNASDIVIMPYNQQNRFTNENVKVNIPSGILYDTLKFKYKHIPGKEKALSGIHQVSSRIYPVHSSYSLSIKPDVIIAGKESKMLIMRVDDNSKIPLISSWEDGYITAQPTTFGDFCIGIDTVPPTITSVRFPAENNFTGREELRIRISDDFSGIKLYEPILDGNWALFEYDQKNDVIIYKFDKTKISQGANHNLTLKVTDRKDNVTTYKTSFLW